LQLHLLRLEIENDFTSKRLRIEKKENREIQDILDLNTIDKRSLEKAIQIFGLYKRYKHKKKKKSRLLRTLVKRNIRKTPMEIEIYYIVLKPGLENNQA